MPEENLCPAIRFDHHALQSLLPSRASTTKERHRFLFLCTRVLFSNPHANDLISKKYTKVLDYGVDYTAGKERYCVSSILALFVGPPTERRCEISNQYDTS